MAIDLVHSPPERNPPLGAPGLLLLEGPGWCVLLVLGGPHQLDLDVHPPLGLQVQPDVMKRLQRTILISHLSIICIVKLRSRSDESQVRVRTWT